VDGPTRTVVVGARNDSDQALRTGSANALRKLAGPWTEAQELYAGDPRADDSFGFSVAISGATIVVGTP